MAKLSVIVPVYKTSEYLPKCMESILTQGYKDVEVILVSDGDEAEHRLCDEYAKDRRVKVLKDIKKGLGGARNAGLDVAKGEFVTFVDSDDWIEPDTFEKAMNGFETGADFVVFGANVVGDEELITKGLADYLSPKFRGGVSVSDDVILKTNVHVWNKVFRKSIIDKFKIRFPENMQYEDFPFYFQYVMASNAAYYLQENLYNYNQRRDSGMTKTYHQEYEAVKDHLRGCYYLYESLRAAGNFNRNSELFAKIYANWIQIALSHCKKSDKVLLLAYAYELFEQMELNTYGLYTLELLCRKRYKGIEKKYLYVTPVSLFGLVPIGKVVETVGLIKVYLFGLMVLKFKRKCL